MKIMKELFIEMSDVETGEILGNTKFTLDSAWRSFWLSTYSSWLDSFERGCLRNRQLNLTLRCRNIPQEQDIKFESDVY